MTQPLHCAVSNEQRRCDAMLCGDAVALATLLADGLRFTHSNGTTDSKAAFLNKFASGEIAYRSITWLTQEIVDVSEGALLLGQMQLDVTIRSIEKRLNNSVLCLWICVAGRWQLLAFQSTPILPK